MPRRTFRCVHCPAVASTRDHVFPTSWYPDNTPANVQRWTVPSCSLCNLTFGKLETELLVRMGLCVDPAKEEASGISKAAIKAFGIGVLDLKPDEKAHRDILFKKVFLRSVLYGEISETPLFPNFGPHAGSPAGEQRVVTINDDTLKLVSGKILRGCEYKLNNGGYIEPPRRLEIYFIDDNKVTRDLTALFESAKPTNLGPGFEVRRVAFAGEEGVLYRVSVWGTFRIYADIITSTEDPETSPAAAS